MKRQWFKIKRKKPEIPVPGKSYRQVLRLEVQSGLREIHRTSGGLFLSAISAGIDIGFSLLVIAVSLSLLPLDVDPFIRQIILANAYSVGFIFVKLGKSELFTEHTTLAVFPVLDRKAGLLQLGRVWGLIYGGNLLGALVFSVLFVAVVPELGLVDRAVIGKLANHVTHGAPGILFFSALLAGWLMGLLSWLSAAIKDDMAKIICVWLVTAAIGFGGLHHCIVGSVEVISGILTGAVGLGGYFRFLLLATLGNMAGGILFSWLKFAHASSGDSTPEST